MIKTMRRLMAMPQRTRRGSALLAIIALVFGCAEQHGLSLGIVEDHSALKFRIKNNTSSALPYSPSLTGWPQPTSGGFYLSVLSKERVLKPPCGYVDKSGVPLSLAVGPDRTIEISESRLTVETFHCVKVGEPYYLRVDYISRRSGEQHVEAMSNEVPMIGKGVEVIPYPRSRG